MKRIVIHCPAKLNLALDIVGVDARGYHLMQMLMQAIDLFDTVTIEKKEEPGITLCCDDPVVPCNQTNIAYRCAAAFFAHVGLENPGIVISLQKRIPQQAGMAGGSADGAGVLVGLNRLFGTELSLETLCGLGEKIGADIPFCLLGGTARVEGIGEVLTPVNALPECALVVVKPKNGVSTQRAFAEFDARGMRPCLDFDVLLEALERQNLQKLCGGMYNALEQVCDLPDVPVIKNILLSGGAWGALMTGSGSAVFGVFHDRSRAYQCEMKLRERYPQTFLCAPVAHGCIVAEEY